MSLTTSKFLVAQIYAGSETYYVCNRAGGITLDTGVVYDYLIVSVGDCEKLSNFGEKTTQVGTCSMALVHGQTQYQGKYVFNTTFVWNNQYCEIRQCDPDTMDAWSECTPYYRGQIKNFQIAPGQISFDIDDTDSKDEILFPPTLIDATSYPNAPTDSIGKRIPVSMGDLTDTSNGVFAKGLLVNEKIGAQEVKIGSFTNLQLNNIGVWEKGLKRYFTGRIRSVIGSEVQGEYSVKDSANNSIVFKVDSATTLIQDMGSIDGIENITVADYTKLQWVDENTLPDWKTYPELLSTNIIVIDSEILSIIEKPTSNTVVVERGYAGSTIADHNSGAIIYQSSKFSSRNLLSFTERFDICGITNQYASAAPASMGLPSSGKYSNLVDSSTDTFVEFYNNTVGDPISLIILNFDLKFPKVEETYTVYDTFLAIKFHAVNGPVGSQLLLLYNPDANTPRNVVYSDQKDDWAGVLFFNNGVLQEMIFDTYTTIDRGVHNYDTTIFFRPALRYALNGSAQRAINITSLSDLDKKWKMSLYISQIDTYIKLYSLGLWIDFFIQFNSRRLCASLQGPTNSVSCEVCYGSTARSTELCQYPVPVLCWLLWNIAGYNSLTDYDTTQWQTVATYFENVSIWGANIPKTAFSFGIDESEKIWEFCQELASNFNLHLIKTVEGKISIVNMHQLQNYVPVYGYPALTAHRIGIDEIIMSGDDKRLSIQQTGSDKIYNDFVVKYKRNNSTDEYQASIALADTRNLTESGFLLSKTRDLYYNGQKRTLEIESKFIYNDSDADWLAVWNMNDKAEQHFYASFTIDYEHYSKVNSLSTQYKIGDVIYLDGDYLDLTLSSSNKWVIRNIKAADNGREFYIEAKSIQPINLFNANAQPEESSSSSNSSSTNSSSSTSASSLSAATPSSPSSASPSSNSSSSTVSASSSTISASSSTGSVASSSTVSASSSTISASSSSSSSSS
jgi:hypothetical protein